MTDVYILQIVNGFSWLLGIIYFIINAVFLDDVVSKATALLPITNSSTESYGDSVKVAYLTEETTYKHPNTVKFFTVLAVWLSLFQMGVTTVIFRRLEDTVVWKLWWKIHLVFAAIAIIVFIVVMEQSAYTISGSKGNAIVGFSAIECVFCVSTSLFVFVVAKRGSFSEL